MALGLSNGHKDWQSQFTGGATNFSRTRHQSKLRAQAGSMSLEQEQVEAPRQDAPARRPDEQDARRLRPRHLVADGDSVIMQLEVDHLGFHLPRL